MYALCHIQWDNTGLYDNDTLRNEHGPNGQGSLNLCLSLGNFRPSNVVLYHLWERDNCVRCWDEFDNLYQTILIRENPENAKNLAKEQYAQKILRDRNNAESPLTLDTVKEAVDHILLRGQRWRALAQAIQSAEILVSYQSRGTWDKYSIIRDVVDHGSDEDFDRMKRLILNPEYHLQETCFRLTGVNDMIWELANAPVGSELRKYLATAIKTRIELVFGLVEEKWPDVPSLNFRLLIVTDYLQRNIVDILGICIIVEYDWGQFRNAPEDSPGYKLYQMYKQFAGEKEHTQDTDDLIEVHGEMPSDSGPTPPGLYADLSPSNFLQFE